MAAGPEDVAGQRIWATRSGGATRGPPMAMCDGDGHGVPLLLPPPLAAWHRGQHHHGQREAPIATGPPPPPPGRGVHGEGKPSRA
uniref:Uncharacterized protein n=1 Tax=Arundo donax TaxID=35708 RepID=A0A0A9C8J1_ARUDO